MVGRSEARRGRRRQDSSIPFCKGSHDAPRARYHRAVTETLGPRPSLLPKQPRSVAPGPRARILEFGLLGHVVIAFLAAFWAWSWTRDGNPKLPALIVAAAGTAILLFDLRRFIALKELRILAEQGGILTAHVLSVRSSRFSLASRADRAFPSGAIPFFRTLEVTYVFEGPDQITHGGRFLAALTEAGIWKEGQPVEIFHDSEHPEKNVPSLVLRWYFRLGGSKIVDETPSADFNENIEIEWME